MPDYTLNPNKKPFASAGIVRGIPAVQTTSNGSEYVRFNLSLDNNMALRQVTVFDPAAVNEAKRFIDRDVVVVAGVGELVERNGKTYHNVTARFCVKADKLYAHAANTSAPAPANTPNGFTELADDDIDLPFG